MRKLRKISLIILTILFLCLGISTKSNATISCAVSISGDSSVKARRQVYCYSWCFKFANIKRNYCNRCNIRI